MIKNWILEEETWESDEPVEKEGVEEEEEVEPTTGDTDEEEISEEE